MGQGTVFIAEECSGWPEKSPFIGHWEGEIGGIPTLFERGPGWDDPDAAVVWGRARARRVLVRLGCGPDHQHFSAGTDGLAEAGALLPVWPAGGGEAGFPVR